MSKQSKTVLCVWFEVCDQYAVTVSRSIFLFEATTWTSCKIVEQKLLTKGDETVLCSHKIMRKGWLTACLMQYGLSILEEQGGYCISSNNSHPSINRLPQRIAPFRQKYSKWSPPSENCPPLPLWPSSLSFMHTLPSQSRVWSSKTDQ